LVHGVSIWSGTIEGVSFETGEPTDKIVEYVPEYGANGKESTTIEYLLIHTAGIPAAVSRFAPPPKPAPFVSHGAQLADRRANDNCRPFLPAERQGGSVPPLALGRHQLPQLLVKVGPLAARLGVLRASQQTGLKRKAVRVASRKAGTRPRLLGRIYIGKEKNYQHFQKLRLQHRMASEQAQAAQINEKQSSTRNEPVVLAVRPDVAHARISSILG
jgi:hypothetical protein